MLQQIQPSAMLLLIPILLLGEMVSGAVVCPDQTERPDGTTCCLMKNDKYGYCPVPEGVCCSDHQHCCPKGYTCNNATCEKRSLSIPYINKVSVLERLIASNSNESHSTKVICDAIHYCQGGNTCCRTQIGEWACCGHPQAVCCANGLNCCPNGFTCDITASICTRNGRKLPVETKKPAQKIISLSTSVSSDTSSIMCDTVYSCPDGYTCCRQVTGRWTCCPHPATVCCYAGTACCPKDYPSGVSTSARAIDGLSIPLVSMTSAVETALSTSVSSDTSSIMCDTVYSCPDGYTCCRQDTGRWTCCPHPATVCCYAGTACCPKDYPSGVSTSARAIDGLSIPLVSMTSAVETALSTSVSSDTSSIMCDTVYSCPDGYTCCRQDTGRWTCCPHPATICCYAGTACCPKDYPSGVSTSARAIDGLSIPLVSMTSAVETALSTSVSSDTSSIMCDTVYSCPDGYTCCRQDTGRWTCCPHPATICCYAGTACCPKDYPSGVSTSARAIDGLSIPLVSMTSAVETALSTSVSSDTSSIICDRVYSCPNGYTCCRQDTGRWTCCPHPATVCCGTKCCPQDFSNLFLTSSSLRVPLMGKKPAMEIKALSLQVNSDGSVIYCDKLHYCSAENTCCRLPSGSWGCCPIPSATFCNDGVHCCPYGMNCDAANSFCTVGSIRIPWLNIKPALIASDAVTSVGSDSSVVNCDKTYFCKAGMTCCSAAKGKWGCCPFPNGQCCEDKQTCCPKHYRCSGGPKRMTCRWKIWSQIPSVENTEEFENF